MAPKKTLFSLSSTPTSEEIFRAHVFEEPLVIVGKEPSATENAELLTALRRYAKRWSPDDFSALTDFLRDHPHSSWSAALLTDLGIEYYNTAHYSLALEAWRNAWALAKNATDLKGIALADRAVGELAYMYARVGRMQELEPLLKSIEGRRIGGSATEKIAGAREGLWMMQNQPGIAFRCGPLALQQIQLATDPKYSESKEIINSASTQQGFSLPQVAELSKKVGLNYQMAFRQAGGDFVMPSVVHWKVGHYAALVRQEGGRYLLQDPTFRNEVWATKEALDAETSGYFLIPPGELPKGWRSVEASEGGTVWGKGQTGGNDPGSITPNDPKTGLGSCRGMMVSAVHLMDVNLTMVDNPVGYIPPVGPSVQFTVRYNNRDAFQPGNFSYGNLGSKFTTDWFAYITDSPQNPKADVHFYVPGGGDRTFTGFDTNSQTFAPQQYDRTSLTRTGTNSYRMALGDGSTLVFAEPDNSIGTTRNVFLTQVIDPQGNAVTLTYDDMFRLVAITDAIGQVTTFTYGLPAQFFGDNGFVAEDIYKITKVTDPFGRTAQFDYTPEIVEAFTTGGGSIPIIINLVWGYQLTKITDAVGLTSQFTYSQMGSRVSQNTTLATDFIASLVTPYGSNAFVLADSGNTRSLETIYPDGSRERVEYTQTNQISTSDNPASVPAGMMTHNDFLQYRNTYYWSRAASELGYLDHSKARLFHWLHTENLSTTSGALESTKQALEGRVWYDYPNQSDAFIISAQAQPLHIGRVLDDGTTQLYTYRYNQFGLLTNSVDPLGRSMTLSYATNNIDLLEVRQSRAGSSELLSKSTYNNLHRRLTTTDAAGQTATYTYNARGQLLTATDPKNKVVSYTYDGNGYLTSLDGPLPGTGDITSVTYDNVGRIHTITGIDAYTVAFSYDNLDRLTHIDYPDGTFEQFTYDRLDVGSVRDRAGRTTVYEHDNMRQLRKLTDVLGRQTQLDWCHCGALRSLTDPMGRTTTWSIDVQGRQTSKQFPDGSQINYFYENNSSRLREILDEQQQATFMVYNLDNTVRSISAPNAKIPTPDVSFTYDPDYHRAVSMTDGSGLTTFDYVPITVPPTLGAGHVASVDGPLTNDTITFAYDELGRRTQTAIDGVNSLTVLDGGGRVLTQTNALGAFTFNFDGLSHRLLSEIFPNGQVRTHAYMDNLHDKELQQLTYSVGATPISQFTYERNIPKKLITSWSQQSGAEAPSIFALNYDAVGQLTSGSISNQGNLTGSFVYKYDPAGNRLTELAIGSSQSAAYNVLNQITTTTAPSATHTNEWDGFHHLVAVNEGNQRTEFSYDGLDRRVGIRKLVNGVEVSNRRFLWVEKHIVEERDASGKVVKRYFPQGMKLETGAMAGSYYYTRDHLGSIRALTDSSGAVRGRFSYDPYGRRTVVSGDVDSDFGYAGMFWSPETRLSLTRFRAYDPELGRWLSRDPLRGAEIRTGPNIYAYVNNDPINSFDPEGLISTIELCANEPGLCAAILGGAGTAAEFEETLPGWAPATQNTISMATCAAPELPDIPDALPTLQQITDELPDLPTVADRLSKMHDIWENKVGEADFDVLINPNNPFYGMVTDDLYDVESIWFELSNDLALEKGIPLAEAMRRLVEMSGIDPRLWPNY